MYVLSIGGSIYLDVVFHDQGTHQIPDGLPPGTIAAGGREILSWPQDDVATPEQEGPLNPRPAPASLALYGPPLGSLIDRPHDLFLLPGGGAVVHTMSDKGMEQSALIPSVVSG